jgi:hypothetical protein
VRLKLRPLISRPRIGHGLRHQGRWRMATQQPLVAVVVRLNQEVGRRDSHDAHQRDWRP